MLSRIPLLLLFLLFVSNPLKGFPASAEAPTLHCERVQFKGTGFDTVRLDLSRTPLSLFWVDKDGDRYQNFVHLRKEIEEEGKTLLFATNSGIYAEDYTPLGLHIENGKTLRRINRSTGGNGNFSLVPNGVFYIQQGEPAILETADYIAQGATPELAVQSGPMLVYRGEIHPKFNPDSESVYVRNGVGIDSEDRVVFAISQKAVNLFTFASYFRDHLGCENALYLDGALSGMYSPCLGREDIGFNYVGILAVVEDAEP